MKANANTKKQVKEKIPAAAKHYAKELMEEVNADREAHGARIFTSNGKRPLNVSLRMPKKSTLCVIHNTEAWPR